MASMYAVYHGPDGLTRIARRTHRLAAILAAALRSNGVAVGSDFFDTLHVTGIDAAALWAGWPAQAVLVGGLLAFGVLFALNSALHSYLIVSYAQEDGVSLDVGFYYMSNALGRLLGTLLSGWVFQSWGLAACLWVSSAFVLAAALISLGLPRHRPV